MLVHKENECWNTYKKTETRKEILKGRYRPVVLIPEVDDE
jgi:hypothetical protein